MVSLNLCGHPKKISILCCYHAILCIREDKQFVIASTTQSSLSNSNDVNTALAKTDRYSLCDVFVDKAAD
jgi:hypothetical protein